MTQRSTGAGPGEIAAGTGAPAPRGDGGRLRPRYPGPLHWPRVFGVGLLCWIVSVVLLITTGNLLDVPTVLLLGSFLVPVTAVVFLVEHDLDSALPPRTIAEAFLLGGLAASLGASALEALLLRPGPLEMLGVGLIEEATKLAALLAVVAALARGLPRYATRDGMVLGAAVGFGFAALESSGYAFRYMLAPGGGLSVLGLVQVELLRSLVAPVMHGLWTAIPGGVLFRAAAATGRLRLTWAVAGAYLGVAALHALWDDAAGVAGLLTAVLTGAPVEQVGAQPTALQAALALLFLFGVPLASAIIGLRWGRRLWRSAAPPEAAATGGAPRPRAQAA
jgi:RsiW-degrading membrane proteinase PrsW (M82 family)